eukprot:9473012-Pyramimonas_sp.AAC.1
MLGRRVVQSTIHQEGTAGSFCADAHACQETPGSGQASGPTPTYTYSYLFRIYCKMEQRCGVLPTILSRLTVSTVSFRPSTSWNLR